MIIVFVARDARQVPGYLSIRDELLAQRPDLNVQIFSGERIPSHWSDENTVTNLFESWADFLQENDLQTDSQLATRLAESTELPNTLFRSDPRYFYQDSPVRSIVLEQIFLEQTAKKILEKMQPDMVITGVAAHLVWTVFNLIANSQDIPSYRLYWATYYNPNYTGVRYWFCRSIYTRLSNDERDNMGWPDKQVNSHVDQLIDTIRNRTYQLDNIAKTRTRWQFIPQGPKQVAQDFYKAFRHSDLRAKRRLKSMFNEFMNRRISNQVSDIPAPYILFPLNMPADEQLTLRAPQFRDIYSACEQIANVLPYGHTLVIKEHPAHPGMLDYSRLKHLLRDFPMIRYVNADLNIHDLLPNASALVSVNSTAALDAIIRNVPVITLGETFYRGTGLTWDVDYFFEAHKAFSGAMVKTDGEQQQIKLRSVMAQLLQETYPEPGQLEPITGDTDFGQYIAQGILRKIAIFESHQQKLDTLDGPYDRPMVKCD